MTGEGSERRDKGKGVARLKKRQRQAPKYVLRVPATLPTTVAPSPSSVGPPPTPVVHPPPTPAVYPPPTLAPDPLPPLVIITPTPLPVIINPTARSDPTSIHSSSCIPSSKTATPSIDPNSVGDGDGVDPPLHDLPWIEPYGKGLSQVRSEHGSTPTPVDASNEDDDIRRTQCWVDVVGGKKNGRVYGARQLAVNYTTSRGGTLKHQPSSSATTTDEAIERFTKLLQQRDQENRDLREEYSDLRNEFTNFKSLVMRALPGASDIHSTVPPTQPRPFPSPTIPQ
ncbi:hypothetical protein LR48_Vigan10g169200 [Vigna angularis]|uniref:Uncharacterized protein n=1 Tax=Phaseolus angularis TaxID=3914 RepID=A0A0L9VL67_PHAAN|nr:hypothetical protein LR48_Vigan10g169200 [Vigna angularis]